LLAADAAFLSLGLASFNVPQPPLLPPSIIPGPDIGISSGGLDFLQNLVDLICADSDLQLHLFNAELQGLLQAVQQLGRSRPLNVTPPNLSLQCQQEGSLTVDLDTYLTGLLDDGLKNLGENVDVSASFKSRNLAGDISFDATLAGIEDCGVAFFDVEPQDADVVRVIASQFQGSAIQAQVQGIADGETQIDIGVSKVCASVALGFKISVSNTQGQTASCPAVEDPANPHHVDFSLDSELDIGRATVAVSGCVTPTPTPTTPSPYSNYWSSTTVWGGTTDPRTAWFVNFGDGYVSFNSKAAYYYVRAVRGGL
jgi:hypothetical protein